jgi:hypothetical protein
MNVDRIICLTMLLTSIGLAAQTKPAASAPPKPIRKESKLLIDCAAQSGKAACKSFKQLVDAHDEGILQILTGVSHHIAYVCFDPKIDVFRVVGFDRPSADRYSSFTSEMPPGWGGCAISLNDKHRLSWDAVSLWLKDVDSFSSYACGGLSLAVYQEGILADFETESGRWKNIGKPQAGSAFEQDASFEGARMWVKEWNEKNEQKLPAEDDSTLLHAGVDPTQINVEYAYENQAGGTTNYSSVIQRSTLRFSETTSPNDNDTISVSKSGTCMVFK